MAYQTTPATDWVSMGTSVHSSVSAQELHEGRIDGLGVGEVGGMGGARDEDEARAAGEGLVEVLALGGGDAGVIGAVEHDGGAADVAEAGLDVVAVDEVVHGG